MTLASESLNFKKPSESLIFDFDKKIKNDGTLQAEQKSQQTGNKANIKTSPKLDVKKLYPNI
jgi:hypothetical protein